MIRFITVTSLLVLAFANLSFADVVELPSTEDTSVFEKHPSTNYSGNSSIWWGEDDNCEIWALIEFGGLSDYSGVSLNSAILSVFITFGHEWGTDDNRVYRITGDWDEDTVSWINRPTYTTQGELVFGDPPYEVWCDLDVTGFVQDWLDGTYFDYGFCLTRVGPTDYSFRFPSREYSDPDYRPKLTLYFPSPVESTSLGLVKAAFR